MTYATGWIKNITLSQRSQLQKVCLHGEGRGGGRQEELLLNRNKACFEGDENASELEKGDEPTVLGRY